jgi:hypothetical protein
VLRELASALRSRPNGNQHRMPDLVLERRGVAAPELRVGAAYREAPATNVATM